MKAFALPLILTLFLGTTVLSAQSSVDEQLKAIQNAPAAKRVELMNQFKQRLANMNAQERTAAINKMRTKMQSHSQEHANEHKEMREHAQQNQMQQTERMQRMEQMQERHSGDQYMQEMEGNFDQNHQNYNYK